MTFNKPTVPHASRITTHLDGQLLVETGTKIFKEPLQVVSPIRDGLRLVIVLQGHMQLEAGDAPCLDVRTPTTFAVLSEGESRRNQVFSDKCPFSLVLLQIERSLIEREFDRDVATLLTGGRICKASKLVLRSEQANTAIRAVGSQLLAEQHMQNGFYRCAKALELAALAFEGFADGATHGEDYLSPSDRERIMAARDALVANADDAPDLSTLARQHGTNLAKLNRGFRAIYGLPPYRYLQDFRLRRSYEMLASQKFTVAQVALATGYTPAHFSTLFRRQFGVSPSTLVATASDPFKPEVTTKDRESFC